ncbi:MAG: energy transducer TonB [Prolixibacteraceae bacterium]|nr:energy transducer TonB [Prolixibacteraceae bacterium]
MELKKSPQANLENKRKIFIELGLVISVLICLYGFESTSGVKQVNTLGTLTDQPTEEELTPLIQEEEKKQVLPPPPKVVDLIVLVDNNTEITEDLVIIDTEATPETAIYANMQKDKTQEPSVDDAVIFIAPEEKPEFPGGDAALLNFLSQNIKYPAIAADNGIMGRVTVNFVVNKDGSISEARILRSVDQALDKEALRVVYSMPKWKPGKQSGKPVRVSFSVPINFVLQQ